MKPAVTLLAIIAMLTALWSRAAVQMMDAPAANTRLCLNSDLYTRIDKGMTYAEVRGLIGAEPNERLCTAGILNQTNKVEIYTWTDASQRAITVCFRDGIFQHKDQAWM